MARRIAHAEWTGELAKGRGEVSIAGETVGLAYMPPWLQEGAGTNAEELLAAAHAASFAMALEAAFSHVHHPAGAIRVRAELHLDHREGTWTITRSDLEAGIALEDDPRPRDTFAAEFERIVEDAATNCPVSRALADVEVTVDARRADRGPQADSTPPQPLPSGSLGEGDRRRGRALEGEVISRIHKHATVTGQRQADSGEAEATGLTAARGDTAEMGSAHACAREPPEVTCLHGQRDA